MVFKAVQSCTGRIGYISLLYLGLLPPIRSQPNRNTWPKDDEVNRNTWPMDDEVNRNTWPKDDEVNRNTWPKDDEVKQKYMT